MPWDKIHGLWFVAAIIGYVALDLLVSWVFNRFLRHKPPAPPPAASDTKAPNEPKP